MKKHTIPKPSGTALLLAVVLFLTVAGAAVADSARTPTPTPAVSAESAQLFAERFFASAREAYPSVGAAVAIVNDGRIVYTGGWGQHALDDPRPIDPEKTLFGAGSIGKLITWTAVMQLVERDVLELDTDVNAYLRTFSVPSTFDEPITLRHLLTHTAGFDDTTIGSVSRDLDGLIGLETYLAEYMPVRLRPPGRVTQYSNYGAALAGYIVGEASGQGFNAYVEERIFSPLAMDRSSFRQPLPPGLAEDATSGHVLTPTGTTTAVPHVYGEIYPAGTGSFTVTDLARFLIAQLAHGGPILSRDTTQTMHARAFANDERLPGMALGFIEGEANGVRTLWHTGTSPAGSHGVMVLVPGTEVGFVMLSNTVNTALSRAFVGAFFDEFFRAAEPIASGAEAEPIRAGAAGRYRPNWHSHHGIEKIDVVVREARITEPSPGKLAARFDDGVAREYVAIGDDLYRDPEDGTLLALARDERGRVVGFQRGDRPIVAYERLPLHETSVFNIVLMNLSLTVLGAFAARPVVGAVIRAVRRRPAPVWSPADRAARSLGVATGALGFGFFILYATVLALASSTAILRSPISVIVLNLPALLILLAVALAIATVSAWKGNSSLFTRIHLTLLTPAAFAIAWFAWNWNILGYMG